MRLRVSAKVTTLSSSNIRTMAQLSSRPARSRTMLPLHSGPASNSSACTGESGARSSSAAAATAEWSGRAIGVMRQSLRPSSAARQGRRRPIDARRRGGTAPRLLDRPCVPFRMRRLYSSRRDDHDHDRNLAVSIPGRIAAAAQALPDPDDPAFADAFDELGQAAHRPARRGLARHV
ncbi:hypothetical protein [Azospirillum thermophilum]|uniref:hypothetical protein n=1 Tax=Azospirillum thermophilum TaxID=2202148 RepID=UPI003182FE9D